MTTQKNVLGGPLEPCGAKPLTGYYRTGCCETGADDVGLHTVCAVMTEAFLRFSLSRGNDLVTPRPEYGFPGLKPGDRWCLCVQRWAEAFDANTAPPVVLEASNLVALEFVDLADLRRHAVGAPTG